MAAVAFYYVTDGSEAVAMVFFIGLGGEKSGFGFRQFPGPAVFHLDAERFPGVAGLEGNAAGLPVGDLLRRFYGIVQKVGENGAQAYVCLLYTSRCV